VHWYVTQFYSQLAIGDSGGPAAKGTVRGRG
jgi:hypothetical protein